MHTGNLSIRRTLDPLTEPVSLLDMKNHLRVDITDDDALIAALISASRERAEDLTSRGLLAQDWTLTLDNFPTYHGIFSHPSYNQTHHRWHRYIILPRGQVISVASITYIDLSGTSQTLDPTLYVVDTLSEPARIAPAYGKCWPVARCGGLNAVSIRFTVGYQQTVAETVTLPPTGPFAVSVSRAQTALQLLTCADATSGTAVAATFVSGILTAAGGTGGQSLAVTYTVTSIPKSFLLAMKLMVSAWYENRAQVVQGGGNFNTLPAPISATSLLGTYDLFTIGLVGV